ncbi:MAG: HD domain-containing protein, partial [Spirochaetales bacterium]|nr:HD domain-containing protein [Spirochaetales bacterium]
MECEIENDIQLVKKYIGSKDRLLHCISTAENMARYSSLFNIDYNTAYFCGLYHDLAKELSPQEMLELTESFVKRDIVSIAYLDFKRATPTLLHGVASAELLIREYGNVPKDRLVAICAHTLGGQKLSRLAK